MPRASRQTEPPGCVFLKIRNTANRHWFFFCKTHDWTSPQCYDNEDSRTFLYRHVVSVRPPPKESNQLRVWKRTRERMEAAERAREEEAERVRMQRAFS